MAGDDPPGTEGPVSVCRGEAIARRQLPGVRVGPRPGTWRGGAAGRGRDGSKEEGCRRWVFPGAGEGRALHGTSSANKRVS